MADANKTKLYAGQVNTAATAEDFLLGPAELAPRSALKRAFAQKRVKANGRVIDRQTLLLAGDQIEVLAPAAGESIDLFARSELKISANSALPFLPVAQDPHCLVVHKPAGQSAHPLRPSETETTLNAIAAYAPEAAAPLRADKPLEGGLVHRLDRGTSGLLVCAKNAEAFAHLRQQWKERALEKVYLAWVHGFVKEGAQLELRLTHDEKSRKRMAAARGADEGWPALTSIFPLRTLTLETHEPATLLAVRIHTGVMHQIRASLALLGNPVLSDDVYTQTTYGRARVQAADVMRKLEGEDARLLRSLGEELGAQSWQEPRPEEVPEKGFFLHAWHLRAGKIELLEKGIRAEVPAYFGRVR